MKRWLAYGGVVGLIALALLWARRDREAHGRSVRADEGEGELGVRAASAQFASADGGPLVDRKRRDELLEVLRAMYGDGAPEVRGASAPNAHQASRSFAREDVDLGKFIQDRVRTDFMPLGMSCYTAALAKDPALGGKVMIKFRIVGDPDIGGVVDEAEIDRDASTLGDRGFLECLSESMQSVVFEGLPYGGYVTVHYPFEFSPDDDVEGGQAGDSGAK